MLCDYYQKLQFCKNISQSTLRLGVFLLVGKDTKIFHWFVCRKEVFLSSVNLIYYSSQIIFTPLSPILKRHHTLLNSNPKTLMVLYIQRSADRNYQYIYYYNICILLCTVVLSQGKHTHPQRHREPGIRSAYSILECNFN